jgi:hypothetical protein
MATSQNRNNTKTGDNSSAKQTYTGIRYGNDHGSISFGHVHKQGDVVSDVLLQASDGRHHISLDKDGQRKGTTTVVSPKNFQVKCGYDNSEAQDSMFFNAVNGNIALIATNGKLRIQATDIEIVAVGEGGSKGNVRIKATESIELDGKKVIINAKSLYKLATPGTAEIVSNTVMKIYAPIIQGVTDAVATRDSKVGGQDIQIKQNLI